MDIPYLIYKAPEPPVRMKFGVVTELSTFLIITQVSSGFLFSSSKYLDAKVGSLGIAESCLTIDPIS